MKALPYVDEDDESDEEKKESKSKKKSEPKRSPAKKPTEEHQRPRINKLLQDLVDAKRKKKATP